MKRTADNPIHVSRPEDVDESSDGGPADDAGFLGRVRPGERLRQDLARDQGWKECAHARRLERLRRADAEGARVDEERRERAGNARDRITGGDGELNGLSTKSDAAPVVNVRDVPGEEDEQEIRGHLHEADEAQTERAVGELVHLPRNRDDEHLVGDHGGGLSQPEAPERAVLQKRHAHA